MDATQAKPWTPETTEQLQARLQPAIDYIDQHFMEQSINLIPIARSVNISPFHFHRLFKKAFGHNVKKQIDQKRIAKAQSMMQDGEPLAKIAVACGFAHQSHFCSRFKQLAGLTPRHWVRANPKQIAAAA